MQASQEHMSLLKLGLLITKTLLQFSTRLFLVRNLHRFPCWGGRQSQFQQSDGGVHVHQLLPSHRASAQAAQQLLASGLHCSGLTQDPREAHETGILHQHGNLCRGWCHVGRGCAIVRKLGGAGGQTGRQPGMWPKDAKILLRIQMDTDTLLQC